MSFNIGTTGMRMGPRGAIDQFGSGQEEGAFINPHVVRRLLKYLRPYWRQMTGSLLLMLINTTLTLLTPYLIGKVAIALYAMSTSSPVLSVGRISLRIAA